MAYTDATVNLTDVTNATAAVDIDDKIIATRRMFKERFEDVLGVDADIDPNVPTKLGDNISITTKQIHQSYTDLGNITGAVALDFDVVGNIIFGTLTGNITLSVSNMKVGAVYMLIFAQDPTGARTITLPAALRTPGGATLPFSVSANRVSIIQIIPYTGSVGLVVLGGTNYNVS